MRIVDRTTLSGTSIVVNDIPIGTVFRWPGHDAVCLRIPDGFVSLSNPVQTWFRHEALGMTLHHYVPLKAHVVIEGEDTCR